MPYTEEQLRRIEEYEAKQALQQVIPEEETDSDEEKGFGEIFSKSWLKGRTGRQISFGQTALYRAEARGDEEAVAEKEKTIEEKRAIAEEEIYRARYGEEGVEQFKNLTDPKWWAATIGEAVPGSVPFLAGAAAGGTAGMYFGPYGAIVGAMLGGGGAVFAQEFGNAYYEYLEKTPDDKEGAENYALKKSGLSGIINAATVPLALVGRAVEPLKRSIIQAMLQAGAETGDTVTGNLLVKEYIDPNMDPTTGVARGIAGELAFEAPALASGVRGRHSRATSKQEREEARKNWEEKSEEILNMAADSQLLDVIMKEKHLELMSRNVDEEIEQIADELPIIRKRLEQEIKEKDYTGINTDALKKIAEVIDVTVLPGDNAEAMFNKVKEKYITDAQQEIAFAEMQGDLLSELTFEDRFNQQSKIFDEMSGQDLFDYVQKEFEGATPEKTWDNFIYWAEKQGDYSFLPPAFESEMYNNPEMTGQWGQARKALAYTSAGLLHREATSGPIWSSLEGRGGYRNYIENLSSKYTKDELQRAVEDLLGKSIGLRGRPGSIKAAYNTKSGLASVLAGRMMVLENQRLKKEKVIRPEVVNVQPTEKIAGEEQKGIKITPHTLREISEQGNAYGAAATLYNIDGTEKGTIYFQRELLEDKDFDNLVSRAIFDKEQPLSDAEIAAVGKLGRLVATKAGKGVTQQEFSSYEGKTIEELVIDPLTKIADIELTSLRLVGSTRPADQRGFLTSGKGWISSLFRPMGKMGLVSTTKQKATEARLRLHDQVAKEIASDVEVAIIKAAIEAVPKTFGVFKNKKYLQEEQRIRNLVRSFLKKTGTYVELSKEEKYAVQKEIERLEAARSTAVVANEQEATEYEQGIRDLRDLASGSVATTTAAKDLPTKQLRNAAIKARKGIDALTTRILNEFPKEMLGDKDGEIGLTRQVLEEQLDSYAVTSFAMFEPKLGFNPKFSKTFLRSPTAQRLYEAAVIAVNEMNSGDPNWKPEDAFGVVDDIVNQTYFSSAADTATLPGVLRVRDAAQTGKLPSGPKLLQERFKIPFAIRRLMGEITDPKLMVASSFSRIAKLIETQNFYRDLLRINNMPGEMMFSQNKVGPFNTQINPLDEFNPLKGLWTTKDIAGELGISTLPESHRWNAAVTLYENTFLRAKGGVQAGMIVLSPGTQSRNAFGAALMYTAGGHLYQGSWTDSINIIREELFPGLSYNQDGSIKGDQETARKNMRTARLLGISNTSATLNDAFGIFNEMSSGKYNTTEKITHGLYALKHLNTETPFTTAMTLPGFVIDKTVGKVWRTLKGTYAAVDDFFKLMTWGANKIEIRKSLDRLSDAAVANGSPPLSDETKLKILRDYSSTLTTNIGTYRSNAAVLYRNVTDLDGYIDHLSAHITRNTIPNYDYVGAFARFWRQLPLGNFIAFPTEMTRVTGNLVQMQYKDATYSIPEELMLEAGLPPEQVVWNAKKNAEGEWVPTKPYIKQIAQRPFNRKAMKRLLIGGGTIVGLPAAFVAMTQMMYDVDDEDLEAADEIGAEYSKNSTRAPTSPVRDDGSGFSFILLDYLAPFMFLQRSYNAVESNIKDREEEGAALPRAVMKGLWEGVVQFAEDYYQISIAAQISKELFENETPTNKQIYNPADNLGEKLSVGLKYALDNAGPGGYRQVRDLYKAVSEGDDRFTKSGKMVEVVASAMKLAGMTQGEASPDFSLGFYMQKVKDLHADTVAYNMNPVRWDKRKITEGYILDQWQDSQEAWFLIQQDIYMKIQAFKKLKVSPKEYREQTARLGQIAGVDASIIRNIEKGVFTPWTLPPTFQRDFIKAKREYGLERTWPRAELSTRHRQLKAAKISLLGNPYLPIPWEED